MAVTLGAGSIWCVEGKQRRSCRMWEGVITTVGVISSTIMIEKSILDAFIHKPYMKFT